MENKLTLIKGYLLLVLFLGVYIGYGIFTYKDFGITADEYSGYIAGDIWFHHYTNTEGPNDFMVRYAPVNSEHNRFYTTVLYSIVRSLNYDAYHFLNIIFTTPLFIVAFIFAWKHYKNIWAGAVILIFLFFTPRFMGDIPANPKDVPFAVAYFISTILIFLSTTEFFKKYPYLKIILIGGMLGYTQSIRAVGLTLYPVLFFWTLINTQEKRKNIINIALETFTTFLISLFVMCVIWPAIGFKFFSNFKKHIFLSSDYNLWEGSTLFNGTYINSATIPYYYLPIWLAISTPIAYLLLTLSGAFLVFKKSSNSLLKYSLAILIYNLVIYFVIRPVSYNGIRHFLFFVVWITFFSGIALIELSKILSLKRYIALLLLVTAYLGLTGYKMYKLYPYYYSYFNEVIGSYANSASKFDSDYWGASYREAANKLIELSGDYKDRKLKYFPCKMGFAMNYYLENIAQQVEQPRNADYFVCTENKYREKKLDGTKIYDIGRLDYTYESIYKRNPKIPPDVYKEAN